MILEILHRYLMIVVACIALLVGIQVPGFVDQYQKRVDAHLREVTINLQPYQDIANKYFGGSIEKLIELHRKSEVKPFQEEGSAIEKMYQRKQRFSAEMQALNAALPYQIAHVLFSHDPEMLDETLAQYSYTVPLNQDALLVGAALALVILLLLELLLAVARFVAHRVYKILWAA